MYDIQLALLGDHEAAKRLTDQGIIIPCPKCGNPGRYETILTSERGTIRGFGFHIACRECRLKTSRYALELSLSDAGAIVPVKDERKDALLEWNVRPEIISAEELEVLK